MKYGDEIAIFLQIDSNKVGSLKNILAYITDEGMPTAKFIVNVYSKSATDLLPGDLLGSKDFRASKGNEWVNIDVSDMGILINGGVFISIKWICDSNTSFNYKYNSHAPWHYSSTTFISYDDDEYNGQVLGTTWDYGILSRTFVKGRLDSDWRYLGSPIDRKKNVWYGSRNHWFNPMIYAKYTQ